MEFQAQKRKLLSEFATEKDALLSSFRSERSQLESAHRDSTHQLQHQIDDLKLKHTTQLDDLHRKQLQELQSQREKFELEKSEMQIHLTKKLSSEFETREKEIKLKLTQERDEEIEMVISKLTSELDNSSDLIKNRHHEELEYLKKGYEDDLKNLRGQLSVALDRVLESQKRMEEVEKVKREAEKRVLELEGEKKVQDNLISQQSLELNRLHSDEATLTQNIRQEFINQLDQKDEFIKSLQSDIIKLKNDIQTLQSGFENQMEELNRNKETTLHHLESRVRQTILAKDQVIQQLKLQLEEETIKCEELNRLIEKQRVELLS
ncbi:hypothetical protein BKA69DRAFT_819148 [Paraphysoderma sedebokerense]|nr:hypothetical protein BKA69DRAFT_819148 [Paraphysoderma sedebokerense]